MQNEFRLARIFLLDAPVKVRFFPKLYALGFALYEVAPHGETCFGEV